MQTTRGTQGVPPIYRREDSKTPKRRASEMAVAIVGQRSGWTKQELTALGVNRNQISLLLRDGYLHKIYAGLYVAEGFCEQDLPNLLTRRFPDIWFTGTTAFQIILNSPITLPVRCARPVDQRHAERPEFVIRRSARPTIEVASGAGVIGAGKGRIGAGKGRIVVGDARGNRRSSAQPSVQTPPQLLGQTLRVELPIWAAVDFLLAESAQEDSRQLEEQVANYVVKPSTEKRTNGEQNTTQPIINPGVLERVLQVLDATYRGVRGYRMAKSHVAALPANHRRLAELLLAAANVGYASSHERRVAAAVRARGFRVLTNEMIGGYCCDHVLPDERVVVELDSLRYHQPGSVMPGSMIPGSAVAEPSVLGDRSAGYGKATTNEEQISDLANDDTYSPQPSEYEINQTFIRDRWKGNYLVRHGWTLLRFTDFDLLSQFDTVIDVIVSTAEANRAIHQQIHGRKTLQQLQQITVEQDRKYDAQPVWEWCGKYYDPFLYADP